MAKKAAKTKTKAKAEEPEASGERDFIVWGSGGVTYSTVIRARSAEEARRIAEEGVDDLEWESELDDNGPNEITDVGEARENYE